VRELDAGAQLEFPGGLVDAAPAEREARLQRLVFVLVDQAVKDMAQQRVVGREVVEVRIHGRRLGRQPDLELLTLRRGRPRNGGGHEDDLAEPDDLLAADHVSFSPRLRRTPMRQESALSVHRRYRSMQGSKQEASTQGASRHLFHMPAVQAKASRCQLAIPLKFSRRWSVSTPRA